MAKRIVFTGGGTVGHVTLNLLLMPKFLSDSWEVHYIGDKKGVEYKELKASGLPVTFHGIATGKLRRYFSWQNLFDIFKVGFGIIQSFFILLWLRPKALFSKGGFVSVPPVIASKLTRVPVFIHESDLSMGLANRIASRFATKIYTTFEQDCPLANSQHVGAVTKVGQVSSLSDAVEQVLSEVREQFDSQLPTLLFVGGSGGAKVFNDFIDANPDLMTSYNVINLSGEQSLDGLFKNLYRVSYVTDLYQPLMDMADVVVTRGGSNTLFELLAMAKPHIIVPLGKVASRGDQLENAAYFVKKGYAKSIAESDLTFERLSETVDHLLTQRDVYKERMSQSDELKTPEVFYHLLLKDME